MSPMIKNMKWPLPITAVHKQGNFRLPMILAMYAEKKPTPARIEGIEASTPIWNGLAFKNRAKEVRNIPLVRVIWNWAKIPSMMEILLPASIVKLNKLEQGVFRPVHTPLSLLLFP